MAQMTMGQCIRALRLQKGTTQEALASALGVTYQAVSKWENGVTMPDVAMLPDIAVYFGVSIDTLFALPEPARMLRIENMLDNQMDVAEEQFDQSETFLKSAIASSDDNARACHLLARLYLEKAAVLKKRAVEYAKSALEQAPEEKYYYAILINAMDGVYGDYYLTRRYALIAYLQDFALKHPDNRRAYAYLMDQLMDDNRIDEAEAVLARMRLVEPRHVTIMFYDGDIAYVRGNHERALAIWAQATTDYDGERWLGLICYAERMERLCRYPEAIVGYTATYEAQPKPRYVDSLVAMAQIHEMQGDYEAAARCREMEIETKQAEWQIVSGDAIDFPNAEIRRLRRLKPTD